MSKIKVKEKSPLKQVISGGQTGVDQSALIAASMCDIVTGGWMPKGYRTLDGPNREFAEHFGLEEHSGGYKQRTYANVCGSDATLRIALTFGSAGEQCTLNAIRKYGKIHMDVKWNGLTDGSFDVGPEVVARWIIENKIVTLNVAGNSEQTAPGIEEAVESYFSRALIWGIPFVLWQRSRQKGRIK